MTPYVFSANDNLTKFLEYRVWAMTENKVQFQQFFITWIINNYTGNEPVYLGGSHLNELTHCMKLFDKEKSWERLPQCEHEEADDRMMFHVDHGIRVDKFQNVVVASSDTDVFICLVYHFSRWIYFALEELWVVSGKSNARVVTPIHKIVDNMTSNVVDGLPAVHALTGCDTTSNVGTKLSALNAATKYGYDLLYSFGKSVINQEIILSAEKCLVHCVDTHLVHCVDRHLVHCVDTHLVHCVDTHLVHCVDTHLAHCVDTHLVHCVARNSEIDTFDDLRNHTYHLKSFQ